MLVGRLLMPPASGPTIVGTPYGFEILVEPAKGKGLEREIYFCGTYEAGTLHVMRHVLRDCDTFLDVGSNIGFLTLFAAHLVGPRGSVHSFEPAPETYEILCRNLALNAIGHVMPHPIALGSASSTLKLHYHEEISRGSSSLVAPSSAIRPGTQVQVRTLDEIVTRYGIAPPRMIKIDVEGWEFEVLRGAEGTLSGSDAPILCIECSHLHRMEGGTPREMCRFIESINDFTLYRLAKGKRCPSRLVPISRDLKMPAHDNLFCLRSAHVATLPEGLLEPPAGSKTRHASTPQDSLRRTRTSPA